MKNMLAKFHPESIWNDGALGFWNSGSKRKNKNTKKKNSDMKSVHDLNINL